MTTIDINRADSLGVVTLLATIKPDDNSVQVKKVMGDNLLNISFEDSRIIPFKINDFCVVFGETYSLSQLPVITKGSKYDYRYSMTMYAPYYDLTKAQYMFLGSDNTLRESEFSLMGNAQDFLNLLLQNANRTNPTWITGEVITTDYKNLTFSKENCYDALVRIAEAFNTEFSVEGKIIHLNKRLKDTGHTYRNGRNRGLWEITRQTLNNSNVVTRLYAYGSEKNLPPSYITTVKRLRFPGGYNPCLISNLTCTLVDNGDGTQTFGFNYSVPLSSGVTDVAIEWRLAGSNDPWQIEIIGMPSLPRSLTIPTGSFEFRFRTYGTTCWTYTPGYGVPTAVVVITAPITTPIFVYTPLPYVERNISVYGVIEETIIFDDIYPHRTGTVSSVNIADVYEFTDASMTFDVNSYLLPGLTPKITFNTGQLSGYTFDLRSYDNGTKKFIIHKNGDEKILDIPSSSFKPAIGDKYVITDIEMPTSYVTAAENELLAAANAKLVELSEPQLSYTVVIDPKFIKRTGRTPRPGDLVWIEDTELEVQKKIRMISVTRNIVADYQYQVELSDIVSPSTIQRIIASSDSNDRNINQLTQQVNNNSILNNNVMGTLAFNNMPTTTTMTGFSEVVIEDATGKLHKKV